MDLVSSGARVLAFITSEIQSTEIISNLLADIKGAPEIVALAGSTIATLQEDLAQCRAVSGEASAEGFTAQIKNCSDDLARFVSRLSMLQTLVIVAVAKCGSESKQHLMKKIWIE